jgi:hypothetical protein
MKFVSKFNLGLPISWQTLVSPGHGILSLWLKLRL